MSLPRVMIGMPIGSGYTPWPTTASLIATVRVLDKEGIKFKIEAPTGCSVVQWARSSIAEAFLKSDFTHLFWIDGDISWSPDDFFRILGFGAVLDVVGAAYPFKKLPVGFLINLAGEPGKAEVNKLGCVRIESMGIGFSLFKREVVEKIAATKPLMRDDLNGQEYRDIFRVDRTPERGPRGEDIAFFNDARDAGYAAWLDPSIRLTHIGPHGFKGDPIEALGLSAFAKEIKAATPSTTRSET